MAGEGEQPTGPSGDNPLRKLYDSLGGHRLESPFVETPEFRQGFEDYHLLLRYRENIGPVGGRNPKGKYPNNDLHPGEHYTKGIKLRNYREATMHVPADTPLDYATSVSGFIPYVSDLLNQGKSIRLGINTLYHRKQQLGESPRTVSKSSPELNVLLATKEDLEGIRKHMIGFGKAALDEGDIKVALLSFQAAGALDDKQVAKVVEEVVRDGGKDMKEEFRKTTQVIQDGRTYSNQSSK